MLLILIHMPNMSVICVARMPLEHTKQNLVFPIWDSHRKQVSHIWIPLIFGIYLKIWVSLTCIRVWMSVMFCVWMNHERHVLRMNELYHIWSSSLWSSALSSSLLFMCSVSHTNELFLACGSVMAHTSRSSSWSTVVSPSLSFRCVTYEWVISGVWMTTHVDESWHTHQRAVCGVWSSLYHSGVSCMKHEHEWVISHLWMSYITCMNESCLAWGWFVTHTHQGAVRDPSRSHHLYYPV